MRLGMLWFDDTHKPLADKIARAADHYEARRGERPTVCYVHPTTALGAGLHGPAVIAGVQIKTTNIVLPNHFWLGDPQLEPTEAA